MFVNLQNMGNSQSGPAVASTTKTTLPSSECPMDKKDVAPPAPSPASTAASPPSECPMHVSKQEQQQQQQQWVSECPSSGASGGSAAPLGPNEVDPRNMMPPPNQRPAPDQPFALPTDRVKSSIPKSGANEGETWVYPSQQMFWNAMLRKVSHPMFLLEGLRITLFMK